MSVKAMLRVASGSSTEDRHGGGRGLLPPPGAGTRTGTETGRRKVGVQGQGLQTPAQGHGLRTEGTRGHLPGAAGISCECGAARAEAHSAPGAGRREATHVGGIQAMERAGVLGAHMSPRPAAPGLTEETRESSSGGRWAQGVLACSRGRSLRTEEPLGRVPQDARTTRTQLSAEDLPPNVSNHGHFS